MQEWISPNRMYNIIFQAHYEVLYHISNNHLPLGELKNNSSLNYALSDSHFIILMLLNTINPLPKNTSVMKLPSLLKKKKNFWCYHTYHRFISTYCVTTLIMMQLFWVFICNYFFKLFCNYFRKVLITRVISTLRSTNNEGY